MASKHRQQDPSFNGVFKLATKETPKFRISGYCEGNPPVTGVFCSQRTSKSFFVKKVLWIINVKTSSWILVWYLTTSQRNTPRQIWLNMMTSSNGNIFRVTGPLCGEFTGPGEFPAQWPVTQSFDVFFDLRLNKRLSKHPWGWWFETPPWSLWRQCNEILHFFLYCYMHHIIAHLRPR